MYNRLICAITNRTIHSYKNIELNMFISIVSEGEVGKFVEPLPFVIDVLFNDNVAPKKKESVKELRRVAYYILKTHSPTIRNLSEGIEKDYKYKFDEYPSKEDIDEMVNAIIEFPSELFEIKFKSRKISFTVVPFIAEKSQVDLIKSLDLPYNFFFKERNDLIKRFYKDSWDFMEDDERIEGIESKEERNEEYEKIIKRSLDTNNFKRLNDKILDGIFYMHPSFFRYIGMNGKLKKGMESYNKMIDVYWLLLNMSSLNINMNSNDQGSPSDNIEFVLINYKEESLKLLRKDLK